MDYINNSCNNSCNNDNDNSKLFYKIIRNKFLFNLILYFLKSDQKRFTFIEDFLNYKRYERLESIDIKDKKILENLSLLPSIRHIALHRCEDEIPNSLIRQIPDSVISLEINSKVEGPLPANIKYLKLYSFKRELVRGYISASVEKLVFCEGGILSNLEALGTLEKLKYLDLGCKLNYNLQNAIPDNLETLKIKGPLNYPIYKGDLKNIKNLILLSDCSSLILNDSLPNSLVHLEFLCELYRPLSQIHFPKSLTSLYYNSKFPLTKQTPINFPNLKIIQFGSSYHHKLHYNQFPKTLEQITLGTQYNHPFDQDSLPKQLLTLKLNLNFNHPIIIPSNSITHLDLNNSISDHKLKVDSLPKTLLFLKLPQQFNHEIPLNCLPVNLKYLYFGLCFNQSIQYCLPPNLVEIHFGDHYNTIIEPNSLPSSLNLLSFSPTGNFNQPFSNNSIPPNTTTIQLSHKYNHPINTAILPKNSLKKIIFNNKIIYNSSILLSSELYNPYLNK